MARLWSKRTPAFIVTRCPIVMASFKRRGGDRDTADVGRRALHDLLRLSGDSRYLRPVGMRAIHDIVLAFLHVDAQFPLVIRLQPPGRVVAQGRLGRRADDCQVDELRGGSTRDAGGAIEPTRDRGIGCTGSSSCENTNRPARTSHTVLGDKVCVRWPKVMAGTEHVRAGDRVVRRRNSGALRVDPGLAVKALNQLQSRRRASR